MAVSDGAPPLQLPWPTGQIHNINGGSTYNCKHHVGRDRFAIDFHLGAGDAVSAVAPGIAHAVNDSSGYGNLVWVNHGNGVVSLYGHLSEFGVSDGQSVEQGELLGLAGSTGLSTGPHLHLALHDGATTWADGAALLAEPMSGYSDFGHYGVCQDGRVSPDYISKPPGDTLMLVEDLAKTLWPGGVDDALASICRLLVIGVLGRRENSMDHVQAVVNEIKSKGLTVYLAELNDTPEFNTVAPPALIRQIAAALAVSPNQPPHVQDLINELKAKGLS